MRRVSILSALLATVALAAACGGGSGGGEPTPLTLTNEGITPVPANSELVVGPNRFNLGLLTEDNKYVLGTQVDSLRLRFSFGGEVKDERDARFVWATPDRSGFFAVNIDFDQAGQWEVEPLLRQNGKEVPVRRGSFTVLEQGSAPNIGQAVPATKNLTVKTEPNIKRLSTDPSPDRSFYQMTVAEALQAGKPFVVVFATPAFCQTRFCGPILDNVKAVAPGFAGRANFIHIEPYNLDAEGSLATNAQGFPVAAPPTEEWRLENEPWIFVVDAQGKVSSRFEGAVAQAELRQAIEAAGAA